MNSDVESQSAGNPEDQQRATPLFVLRPGDLGSSLERGTNLLEVWSAIWSGRWLVIIAAAFFFALSVAYVMLATPWYEANVVLAPTDDDSMGGVSGSLGGLASLAGFRVGGTRTTTNALAVLQSRDFTRSFIEDNSLLPVLFSDEWDPATLSWSSDDPEDWPDLRDGVKFFEENIRGIEIDLETGIVTLSIEWTNPDLAAQWANDLADRLNLHMRDMALAEAERNVDYLSSQLTATAVVTMQQAIGSLLEVELQKLMLARGNEEFAFKIIDRAEVPKLATRPRKALTVILATFFGVILTTLILVMRFGIAKQKEAV